ncbi:hypothetical protein [Stackebrandtia nassauensis]|uniref:Uncharacterized protein n=1 Tax=Stackebrandtia nassauensis (strain DSM 44728 / CIP 108903 / NRRL B-16338 / NBRC 102104 / LLR-40K-21) TaxID=446470 RepID=D3Q972_STANL|nr:hypothetical protein [Stackebrandtia nassauensis]ADD40681.1 hypothetical protein Snas_0971 [Stackebrandtia nassauensis DSM 44728]
MTMTTVKSAYPASIADLMPKARKMAEAEGLPSQNRFKETLRIGRPKARELRAALEGEGFQPQRPEPAVLDPDPAPVVPDPVAGTQHDTIELPVVVVADEDIATPEPQDIPVADPGAPTVEVTEPVAVHNSGDTGNADTVERKPIAVWPVLLLLLPATVAIWSGWVGLGKLAGFGPVSPLPGIVDSFVIDTSITLPIGMETYSAYALYVWLSGRASIKAIKFARTSALIALATGAAGQIAYHLMTAANVPAAHPFITAAVACIPVAVLGLGAALAHLVKNTQEG